MRNFTIYILSIISALTVSSCRNDEIVVTAEDYTIDGMTVSDTTHYCGMYLLNEGNMGSNKCTLDYLDFTKRTYSRNIYPEKNPTVVKELGDVGNDIQIYGNRLYIVVNCSNKVEVADAHTGIRIGQVNIDHCRYICFKDGYAYVSSYVSPAVIDAGSPRGAVYKVDTASLAIKAKVTVGYQPEEMAITDNKLYVANSGGYRAPNYDNTVSIIDLSTMKQTEKLPVAVNLHHIKCDAYGQLWVTSRGDYDTIPSRLLLLHKNNNGKMVVSDTIETACSDFCINGDSLYFFSYGDDKTTTANSVGYGIIDIRTHHIVCDRLITDGTETEITIPYGIAVHPETGDIFITDAKNYVSSGILNCYSRQGKRLWHVRTGDIPSHIVMVK